MEPYIVDLSLFSYSIIFRYGAYQIMKKRFLAGQAEKIRLDQERRRPRNTIARSKRPADAEHVASLFNKG